jgi:hypothetical protein
VNRNLSYSWCGSMLVLAALLLILPACMTVSNTGNVVPSVNSGKEFSNKRIAVLPIKAQTSLAPDSVMPLRVELNKRLGPALRAKAPSAGIVDMPDVANRLNEKGALPVLEQIFSTYENTGVVDKRQSVALGRVLGSDYLLLARLKAEKMDIGFLSKGIGGSLELMLVNAVTGEVAWSGNGEWKRGGMLGTGGAPPGEVAENLIKLAFSSLQSGGEASGSTTRNTPAPPAATDPSKTMETPSSQDKGFSIADVQRRLLELGYKPGSTDGKMGRATIRALKKFQKDNNLPVTGQADNETVGKLFQKNGR